MGNIKRQKIVQRDNFTEDEKNLIAMKSDFRCCHCGKKVFYGYGATVEHFIPLSEGGTNRNINLIMLCKQCNEEKKSYIYHPREYLNYLNEKDLENLEGYFNSYIKSFEFVNRDNILACDRYRFYVPVNTSNLNKNVYEYKNKKLRDAIYNNSREIWVKRATFKDLQKLTDYFVKYLKKYNCLDSADSARINIEFWLTFGCIYYIEIAGEIKTFITVTATEANKNVLIDKKEIDNFLTINVFAYYSTEYALTLAWNLCREIPKKIFDEQDVKQIPIKYSTLVNDQLAYAICDGGAIYKNGRFLESFLILYEGDKSDLPELNEDENLNKFFNKFNKINKENINVWFKDHKQETYDWMVREISLGSGPEDEQDE